jgi:hypothetical protein
LLNGFKWLALSSGAFDHAFMVCGRHIRKPQLKNKTRVQASYEMPAQKQKNGEEFSAAFAFYQEIWFTQAPV